MACDNTQALYARGKARIPGGAHLLSKQPERFAPGQWPAYFREARGCEVWDLDGRRYMDMAHNGVGACLLGYGHPAVTNAVIERIAHGHACTLNPPEEVELAEALCAIHPWATQVRLTRGGGEAGAVAARIARAATSRPLIAVCGYHGWHDWYLAANLGESESLAGHLLPGLPPAGVPDALRGTALAFAHGDCHAFDAIAAAHGGQLAAVVVEPCRHRPPAPGFLEHLRAATQRLGALLIFDEITVGWRLCYGGAHKRFGIEPDMAVFAKALGNGHPIGAVIGTAAAMEGAHRTFISSTSWTDAVGPTAALATLAQFRETDVPGHVEAIGLHVQRIWHECARRHGLPVTVPDGFACLAQFAFDHPEAVVLRTLYTQGMLDRGYLAGTAFYPTLAHTHAIADAFADAVDAVFADIAAALATGNPAQHLRGPAAHEGFQRLV